MLKETFMLAVHTYQNLNNIFKEAFPIFPKNMRNKVFRSILTRNEALLQAEERNF